MLEKYILDENSPIERYFEEISRIPRESGNEKGISDYLVNFAKQRGFSWYRDKFFNVIIRKPASKGYEDREELMIQAHTDMVCTTTRDSDHDFKRDPLELYVDDGMIKARKTSLGADDGWGVAYMLAILSDDKLQHPPLECVFTSQEETTNDGAKNIDISEIKSKRMISLDGDEEDATYVSCFVSDRLKFKKRYQMKPFKGKGIRIKVSDMSTNIYGGIVHQEAGNAIKMVARLLQRVIEREGEIYLYDYSGGKGENFSPEVCSGAFCFDGESGEILELLRKSFEELNAEFDNEDYRGEISLTLEDRDGMVVSGEDSNKIIDLVYLVPNNLFGCRIDDKVLTSVSNIGVAIFNNDSFELVGSVRSQFAYPEEEVILRCKILAQMTGFEFGSEVRYRDWPYNRDSKLVEVANEVMMDMYGHRFREVICPGGLEVANFVRRIKGMDAIELGVNIHNPHAVEETMELKSFRKMYDVLTRILSQVE